MSMQTATCSGNVGTKMQSLSEAPWVHAPQDGADLCFNSPQPDNSLHCETTDTGWCITWYAIRLRPVTVSFINAVDASCLVHTLLREIL